MSIYIIESSNVAVDVVVITDEVNCPIVVQDQCCGNFTQESQHYVLCEDTSKQNLSAVHKISLALFSIGRVRYLHHRRADHQLMIWHCI
jgi:hypothetical protein